MKIWPENWKPQLLSRRGRVIFTSALTIWLCYEAYVLFTTATDICETRGRLGCAVASLISSVLPVSRNVALADFYLALCLAGWTYEFMVLKYKT
jgi:hypothetical protein